MCVTPNSINPPRQGPHQRASEDFYGRRRTVSARQGKGPLILGRTSPPHSPWMLQLGLRMVSHRIVGGRKVFEA